jgi:predicted transcriptional regulator
MLMYSSSYALSSAMAATTTVRVTPETRERLARLSAAKGLSTPDLIGELAKRAEDDALLDEMNEHYAALRREPEALREFVSEREAWEATLLDGLGREE